MRTLILGCGYVGLQAGCELVHQGHEVYGVRRSEAAQAELQAAGIRPLVADLARPGGLDHLPGPFDWVVNTAASTQGGAADYRRVYLNGLRHVISWLSRMVPRKYVYTSSTGVYGQIDGSLVEETALTEPSAETGRVLVETEQLLVAAARETGFPGVVLRVAGIYGPGRGYWLKQFLRGEARLSGTGERILNMIHRDDVAGSIAAALAAGRAGETYNAVDDEPVTQIDCFRWLAQRLGRELPPASDEPETIERRRALTNKRVSNRKLKAELGYQFKYPTFREGYAAELASLEQAGLVKPSAR